MEARFYMFNKKEYDTIVSECGKDNELSAALSDLRKDSLDELSVMSHEIKNYAAYLKTSYQFISRKNSELKDNKFWNNMGTTIDELVEYMNRTSLYRYSFKDSEIVECSVKELIERIRKYIAGKYSNSNKQHSSNEPCNEACIENDLLNIRLINADENTIFHISSHLLTLGINELIDNAYEACSEKQPAIQIKISCDNNLIHLSILNPSYNEPDKSLLINNQDYDSSDNTLDITNITDTSDIYSYDLTKLCTPFFTTKENHTGLGLSSIYQMCILNDAKFAMTYNSASHITAADIILKKA